MAALIIGDIMNIYKNNYLDMAKIIELDYTFIFVIGGRGTGKTYGALDYVIKNNIPTILMRRTQSQLDVINKTDFAPIRPICIDMNMEYHVRSISKQSSGYYLADDNLPLIITVAVSTIANMRGFDASDRKIIIYDEFIPEKHERVIKNEAEAVLNAYETINRNRELKGARPVKLLALANSNDIMNELFIYLKLIEPVSRMLKNGKEYYFDEERSIAIIMPNKSPISDKKAETSLYKLAGNGEFRDMALSNQFRNSESDLVVSKSLKEFILLYTIGELNIYEHKSSKLIYCSLHHSGTPRKEYVYKDSELKFIRRDLLIFLKKYLQKNIYFESIYCLALFEKIFLG